MNDISIQQSVGDWFLSEQGKYVLDWELQQVDNAVDDIFGFYAVQIGLPEIDFLRSNRIPLRLNIGLAPGCQMMANPEFLPLASHSVDLIVLPHVLEFSERPHQILREAERVLMPEGQIVVTGFNPISLWGINRWIGGAGGRRDRPTPWNGRFIGPQRLKDWLSLLGFELNGGQFGCYAPPLRQRRWLERFRMMEKAGSRWWTIGGGDYVFRAIKRQHGIRLVTPPWREQRAKRPALVQVARRDNVIHVRPVSNRYRVENR